MAINPKPWLRVQMIWGVEEPASAFFSFLIVLVFLHQFRILLPLARRCLRFHPSEHLLVLHARLGLVIFWVWVFCYLGSTVFHIYENKLTERIDYFGACLGWSAMLFVSLALAFNTTNAVYLGLLASPVVLFDMYYLHYMSYVSFDYSWHVLVVGAQVLVHFLVYIAWGLRFRRGYAFHILLAHALMGMAVPLELFDFVPIFQHFDGHSLWHAAGAVISYFYCRFIIHHLTWGLQAVKQDDDPSVYAPSKTHIKV